MKNNRIVALLLPILLIFSLMSPILVYADDSIIGDTTKGTYPSVSYAYTDDDLAKNVLNKLTGADGSKEYSTGNIHYKTEGSAGILYVVTNGNQYDLLKLESKNQKIYVNPDGFKGAKKSDATKAMQKFVFALEDANMPKDTASQLINSIQATDSSLSSIMLSIVFEDTHADIYAAYKVMEPFIKILNFILGAGAILLIAFLLFSSVMDLAYIGLPIFRNTVNAKADGNSGKLPFGVSFEADSVVKEIEGNTGGTYKNAYLLYFKRRFISYIVLALCIMYLIAGGIGSIISFLLSLVSGVSI